MKNFKFLLVAAVVFAAGSAFTTAKSAPGEYVNSLSGWIPKDTAPGRCIAADNQVCTFVLSGSSYVPADQNENATYIE